jgi:hypothetical protein
MNMKHTLEVLTAVKYADHTPLLATRRREWRSNDKIFAAVTIDITNRQRPAKVTVAFLE